MRSRLLFMAAIAALMAGLFSGCGGGGGGGAVLSSSPAIRTLEEAQERSTWTVLVYLNADNDLETAGVHNFNQMEAVGSTRDVHVVVQMDRMNATDPYNEKWTDTRRYLVVRDSDTRVMSSIRLDNPPLGEQDMGNWQTLKNFVEWGVQNFPADHYCLVVWDHGSGWDFRSLLRSTMPLYRYISVDDTSYSQIEVPEIAQALQNVNIDVLAFDACYMQELEVSYELRNSARYMVGSAATEPSPGYNYTRWLSRMSGATTPEDLCRVLVEEYTREYPSSRAISQCAVDLSKIGGVATAANNFAQVLQTHKAASAAGLAAARGASADYSLLSQDAARYDLDIVDYAMRCSNAVGGDVTDAYSALRTAVSGSIVAENHSSDLANTSGYSIYMPPPSRYNPQYSQLQIAADTSWDEWIRAQLN